MKNKGKFMINFIAEAMKLSLLMTVFLLSLTASAADKASVHGMLVFGQGTIFFSHLPMFHSPHDYQAIFSVNLSPEAKALYLADKQVHADQDIYTFVPEVMVLSDGALKEKAFKGDLYRGHFERGGVVIAQNIQVNVDQVVVFKKLDPKAMKPTQLSYYLFGANDEQWLAHDITSKPDFDHVIAVKLSASANQLFAGIVAIDGLDNLKPLAEGQLFEANLNGQSLSIKTQHSNYLEFDDLSM